MPKKLEYKRRSTDQEGWWKGNSTKMWRFSIVAFFTLSSFLMGFMFTEVTSIPKIYPTKIEVAAWRAEIRDEMNRHYGNLSGQIDSIDNYLREQKK